MPDNPQPAPLVHMENITGSPVTTIAGVLIGIGQYLATQGGALPHDTQGWVQFAMGLLIAVAGMLVRQPGK